MPESTVTFGALIKSLPDLRDSALIARSTSAPATDQPVALKVEPVTALAKSIIEVRPGAAYGTKSLWSGELIMIDEALGPDVKALLKLRFCVEALR